MQLRQTLIGIVSAVLVLAGVGMTEVFHHHLDQQAAAADRSGARKDMDRLLLALNHQMGELDVVLGSWSNFTAFYDHAAHPSQTFRDDDLSVASIQAAHFDWINLINDQGRVVEHREVALADGSTPVQLTLDNPAMAGFLAEAFQDMVRRQQGCAVLSDGQRLALGCYRPLLASDGSGPARGTVLIGRWVSQAMLTRVRSETGLAFTLAVRPEGIRDRGNTQRPVSGFQSEGLTLREEPERIHVETRVMGMNGRHIGTLHLDWPRESLQRARGTLQLVNLSMVALIALTAVLLIVVCDWLLVRRLQAMRRDLGAILAHESWDGQVHTQRHDELTDLAHYINHMLDIIRAKIAQVQEQSLTDPLTALANRRRFDMGVTSMLAHCKRDGQSGALVLFDIDHFKRYNDTYGHPQGDAVLVRFAQCLRDVARRPGDLPARLGGEEFAILMPLTDGDGARYCAERARAAMQALAIAHSGNESWGVVTVSAGLALIAPGDSAETLYSRADAALYAAKHAGRNQLAVA